MSVIKLALEKQREELIEKLDIAQSSLNEQINKETHLLFDSIDDVFKDSRITVSDCKIEFFMDSSSGKWSGHFSIERRNTYSFKENAIKYHPAILNYSSCSSPDEFELKGMIGKGKIAFHQLNKTKTWDEMVGLMDKYEQLKEELIKPISDVIYEIRNELDLIKRNEETERIEALIKQKTVKLAKNYTLQLSNSRYDNINSNEFFWEENPSGKTYSISYTHKTRVNPYYDENGEKLEGEYKDEVIKLNKRFKKSEIYYLVGVKIREENNQLNEKEL